MSINGNSIIETSPITGIERTGIDDRPPLKSLCQGDSFGEKIKITAKKHVPITTVASPISKALRQSGNSLESADGSDWIEISITMKKVDIPIKNSM